MEKIRYICGQVQGISSWKSKSFTLIELIVAMVIISLIFLLVSSFIWLSFKVSTRSKEAALRYAGIRNVLEIITQETHSAGVFAYPPDEPDFTVSEGKVLSFWCIPPFCIGEGDRVIYTPYENLYRAPIFKLTYESKEKDGKDILYKRIQSPFEDKTVEFPMIRGDFEFSVIYYDQDRKELIETDTYSGKELPAVVKVKCKLPNGEELKRSIFIYGGKRF